MIYACRNYRKACEVDELPLDVTNSPFNEEQTEQLNRLLPMLTDQQKMWLSGYLSAVQSTASIQDANRTTQGQTATTGGAAARSVTILYGSETGTAQSLAETMTQKLEATNLDVTCSAMDDFKPNKLKKVEDLLIITATHGEGDPPDNAVVFHEFLHSRKAPKLADLRFAVLSLGDESYEFFCQTGKDFDARLEELGGERLYERIDCDLDFDEPAAEWMAGVLGELRKSMDQASEAELSGQQTAGTIVSEQPVFSRTNPFLAEVVDNINLSGRGSNKQTRHLELSLEGSNFTFKPGDSLGIFPKNNPVLVDEFIQALQWNPDETVSVNKQGDIRSLREALISNFEISILTKPLVEKAASIFHNEELSELITPDRKDQLKTYIDGRDMLDLVQDYPPDGLEPESFVKILRKIPARLYSIASSYDANPDEVHLTIGKVRFSAHGRERFGVCSTQVADRIEIGEKLPVYIHQNPNFQFPEDPETPVIMIGPGTGVAPFRSYLEELEETEAERKTWLFFGEQHFSSDFLYQVDWQKWLNSGVLSKMDVAFSRDTEEKVYVQHRMLEKSKELYDWVKQGAAIYVCGDEKHMAKDVNETIATILQQEGDMTPDEVESYLNQMRQEKRYQRDVY